jgi:glucose-1-phosphate thymidylyltransferase
MIAAMKALILAGGKGSRLRPITFSLAKQLVPVANKPVIEFGIDAIRAAGITDFGFIVGDTAADVMSALGSGERWNAKFSFIPQDAPLGLAHAVKTARQYLGNDKFIMYLGDNLIKTGVKDLVEEFEASNADAMILLTKVPNPWG